MRKNLIVAACGVAFAVGFSACNKNNEPGYSYSETVNFGTYNIVTAEGQEPYVAPVRYQYNNRVDIVEQSQTISMFINDMMLNKKEKVSIETKALPYSSGQYQIGDKYYPYIYMSDTYVADDKDIQITDFTCILTYAAYQPSAEIPGYPVSVPKNDRYAGTARENEYYTVMSYKIDNKWNVSTFWPDVTFKGATTTTYPGMEEPFTSDKIEYRVVLDLKTEGAPKANVFMINAQFAPKAPMLMLALRNLPVTFHADGYSIDVENVNPEQIEAGGFTENKEFPFDKFSLKFSASSGRADIKYQVKTVFNGSFGGYYFYEMREGADKN